MSSEHKGEFLAPKKGSMKLSCMCACCEPKPGTPKSRSFTDTLCKASVDYPRFGTRPRPGKVEFLAQGHIARK